MKQSNKNRQNGRHGNNNNRFGGNRHQNNAVTRNTVFDSSSGAGRVRGTSQQLIDKYLSLAKDAKSQDDRVLYETYMQYADHYTRMLDLAIQNDQARAVAYAAQQQQAQREAEQQQAFMAELNTQEDMPTEQPSEEANQNPTEKKPKTIKIKTKKQQAEPSAESIVVESSLPISDEAQEEDAQQQAQQPVIIEIPE